MWESIAIGTASALAGLGAWAVFSMLRPMQVLVGTRHAQQWVPVWYQASIFPAFAAFVTSALVDAHAARGRWRIRAAAAVLLALLAGARLSEAIPLSGHGVCGAALIAEALAGERRPESPWVVGLAMASLMVTAWYKLAVWGDATWFGVSVAAGAAIGLAAGVAERSRGAKG